MKRRHLAFVGLLAIMVIIAACGGPPPPINLDAARYYESDEAAGVNYHFSLGVGAFDGKKYFAMGRIHPANDVAFVVRDVFRHGRDVRGIHVWMNNYSRTPVDVTPYDFVLVSPTGQAYTFDWDASWDQSIRSHMNVLLIRETLQPEVQTNVTLFFRTGDRDITSPGWRLGYTAGSSGLFGTRSTAYVWSHIAYRTDSL